MSSDQHLHTCLGSSPLGRPKLWTIERGKTDRDALNFDGVAIAHMDNRAGYGTGRGQFDQPRHMLGEPLHRVYDTVDNSSRADDDTDLGPDPALSTRAIWPRFALYPAPFGIEFDDIHGLIVIIQKDERII